MSDPDGERIARLEAKIDMIAEAVRDGNKRAEAAYEDSKHRTQMVYEQGKAIALLQVQLTANNRAINQIEESNTWWKRTIIGAALVAVTAAASAWWERLIH